MIFDVEKGEEVSNVAIFEPRITLDTLSGVEGLALKQFQHTSSYYVGFSIDSQTLYQLGIGDKTPFTQKLNNPIKKFFVITSEFDPDQLAIFTLSQNNKYKAIVKLIKCNYIPSPLSAKEIFDCHHDKNEFIIDFTDYRPDYQSSTFHFEILSYDPKDTSFVIFVQRDDYAIRLYNIENWSNSEYILISNEDLSQVYNFQFQAYDILIDDNNNYILVVSSFTKLIKITISSEFVWEKTNVVDFADAKAKILIVNCFNVERKNYVNCFIVTNGNKFHQIKISDAKDHEKNGLTELEIVNTYYTSDGMFNPIACDYDNELLVILYDGAMYSPTEESRQMIAYYEVGKPYVIEAQDIVSTHRFDKVSLMNEYTSKIFLIARQDERFKNDQFMLTLNIDTMKLIIKDASNQKKMFFVMNGNVSEKFEVVFKNTTLNIIHIFIWIFIVLFSQILIVYSLWYFFVRTSIDDLKAIEDLQGRTDEYLSNDCDWLEESIKAPRIPGINKTRTTSYNSKEYDDTTIDLSMTLINNKTANNHRFRKKGKLNHTMLESIKDEESEDSSQANTDKENASPFNDKGISQNVIFFTEQNSLASSHFIGENGNINNKPENETIA